MQLSSYPQPTVADKRLKLELSSSINNSQESPGEDVITGLSSTPKTLPARYFYDDLGSQLFEQICDLPEYYLTRTETQILLNYSSQITEITGPIELIELGSGSSTKTRILLSAYLKKYGNLCYLPIDVSRGILEQSALELLADYPTLNIRAFVSTYEQALSKLTESRFRTNFQRMIAFLGSSLGNLSPQQCQDFFAQIAHTLQPGDYFLLGVDLDKSKAILEPAYNDAQGITAQFNLNMLQHLNHRFQGNFNLTKFAHISYYNQEKCQIEMYLQSLAHQTVTLKALDLDVKFTEGEMLLTEISRKLKLTEIEQDLQARGLKPVQYWTDSQQWYGLLLTQLQ